MNSGCSLPYDHEKSLARVTRIILLEIRNARAHLFKDNLVLSTELTM